MWYSPVIPATWETELEERDFKAKLGNIGRPYPPTPTPPPPQKLKYPLRIMVKLSHENDAITTNNSPAEVILGDADRLVRLTSTHHVTIKGVNICIPQTNSSSTMDS